MDPTPILLSLEIAGLATVVAGATGIALATALCARRFPGRDVLDVLATAPLVLPPTVLGYYLLVAVGRRSVLGHAWEAAFGAPIVFTRAGAVLAASVGAFPLVVRTSRAALDAVDVAFVHAARTLGASAARTLATVQLPLARRGLVAALTLAFARSLGDFGITLMVAGDIPGQTRTASLAIYDALQDNQEPAALRLSLVLTAIAMALLYAVHKLTTEDRRGR